MTRLTTLADPEAVAARACEEILRLLGDACARRGVAHLALSGGTTPGRTYELLGASAALEDVNVWFADERCVPPDDDDSNFLLASRTLLTAVPADRVHRMHGELGPYEGARLYAEQLRSTVPADSGSPVPCLDVIVLGIGPDGHVASLFPGAATLDAPADTICLGVEQSPKPPPERITLSLSMLRQARRCVLLATGASKSDAMSAAMAEPNRHVPASLLRRERLTAIVDDAAAPGVSHG
jgi:6-phosphogluconolactonase